MYDNALYFSAFAEQKSTILKSLDIKPEEYVLATIHRDFNTDRPERISNIFKAISAIADNCNIPVVLPLHPRTRKYLPDCFSDRITIIPPASFYDILTLEKNAKIVITDSGGVQKEAFFFGKPSIILRRETEWVEIIEHNAGILADADFDTIVEAYETLSGHAVDFPPLFGDGHAAQKALQSIIQYIENEG